MSNILDQNQQNLPKHLKYRKNHIANDFFWGLGYEHETYLQATKTINVTHETVWNNRRPERYSVSYYNSYKSNALEQGMSLFFKDISSLEIPILINSHALSKTDIFNQAQTLYVKNTPPNPNFCGETYHEYLMRQSSWLKENYEHVYLFDGDIIEFTNLDYYKSTLNTVIKELTDQHGKFIEEINKYPPPNHSFLASLFPLKIQEQNWPIATYTTNLKNYAMFNNGTLHINITLPTYLDDTKKIVDFEGFKEKHKIFARLIQWFEPLLIANFNSPDPFSKISGSFSAASQRLAISRYIGIGTFDTSECPFGKILQVEKKSLPWPLTWYDEFYRDCDGYNELSTSGLDINFNKHENHGLEIRFFDSMPLERLKECTEFIIWLGDFAIEIYEKNQLSSPQEPSLQIPQQNNAWIKMTVGAMTEGKNFNVQQALLKDYFDALSFLPIKIVSNSMTLELLFYRLQCFFLRKGMKGPVGRYMFD
jgi:hypothetical protein